MEDLPDWLKQFFEMPPLPHLPEPYKDLFKYPYGAGTGMIIRSDGYILTSRHVLYHPVLGKMFKKGQITVVLADKRKFTGDKVKVVATDPLTDLAVLKIDADNLPTIKWGDSDKLTLLPKVLRSMDRIPQIRTVVLRSGHMPMIERPEETAFQIERLLTHPPTAS